MSYEYPAVRNLSRSGFDSEHEGTRQVEINEGRDRNNTGRKRRRRSNSRSRSKSPRFKRSPRDSRERRREKELILSPLFDRRPHHRNRHVPEPNKCLGIFGLSTRTTEKDLINIFSKYGSVQNCKVVVHGQTGRSRGFSFVYFNSLSDATAAKEACNGMEIDGSRVRVDYSITQRAHTPTPGIYMGKSRYGDNFYRRRRESFRSTRRSPSPNHRRRLRMSRSWSRSPRRCHYRK